MKAGAVIFAVVVALGAGGGAFYLNHKAEALVDRIVDQELRASGLNRYLPPPGTPEAERLPRLRGLYEQPNSSYALQEYYGITAALWHRQIPAVKRRAWLASRPIDDARLAYEIDERFGEGAAALMAEERQRSLADAAERRAAVNAQIEDYERQREEMMRAVEEYRARTGRSPPPGSRIENGRVVTP